MRPAYVLSFSEALPSGWRCRRDDNLFMSRPPATNFQKRAKMENSRLFKRIPAMDARTVARDGYRGLMAGRPVVISGLRNWLVAESVRFAPRRMVTAMSRWIAEKPE